MPLPVYNQQTVSIVVVTEPAVQSQKAGQS